MTDVVEHTPAGPIRPLDLLYGHAGYATANPLMSHRTGFTVETLSSWLGAFGFAGKMGRASNWVLWVDARKSSSK